MGVVCLALSRASVIRSCIHLWTAASELYSIRQASLALHGSFPLNSGVSVVRLDRRRADIVCFTSHLIRCRQDWRW